MDNSWIKVFQSHLCPSIKLPENNWENNSLLLKILLSSYFSAFKGKNA